MKTIILGCLVLFLFTEIASGAISKKTDPNILAKANRITIPFVKNKGQLENADILYYANTFAGTVAVNKDGSIAYRLAGNKRGKEYQAPLIRETLGTASKTTPTGERKAVAKANYFGCGSFATVENHCHFEWLLIYHCHRRPFLGEITSQ